MSEEKIFDPSMKKKKKKKPVEEEVEAPPEEAPAADDLDFGKKKKKKKKPLDMSDVKDSLPDGNQEPVAEDGEVSLDFSAKKKKKKRKEVVVEDGEKGTTGDTAADNEAGDDEEGYYKYEELLEKAFRLMRERNPEMISGERKRMMMIPPSVARVGTKKTMFANFNEVTKALRRPPRHLLQFLLAELGTSGSIDGNNQLLLKGRYQIKHIENVLRNYIREYVMCHTCKRWETELNKDTRLYFLECKSCGSRCSVQSIKSGFQAVTGKRAALRAKTT